MNNVTTQGLGTGISPPIISVELLSHAMIKPGADLSEKEKKYCRCLLKVEAKGNVRSPYGICTNSVGTQVPSCSQYYDFPNMNLEMLIAYMTLHKIDTFGINSREDAFEAIGKWKASRGEIF